MNVKKVNLLNLKNNKEVSAKLEYTTTYPTKILLSFEDTVLSSEKDDLLETLIDIRKQLNVQSLDILVNGSRKNIASSPMLRGASSGEKTYLIRLGVQARPEDIVTIFEPIPQEYFSSYEEQKRFYKIWSESLEPSEGEIEEAKKHPNGFVYRLDRQFSKEEAVPPEAIIGAWIVNSQGKLTGEWVLNENYIPIDIRENVV